MRIQLNKTTSGKLRNAILYSIGFSKMLLGQNKIDLVGETVIQLIKDAYLLKTGNILQENIVSGAGVLDISFTDNESFFLTSLEKSLRLEKDYAEFSAGINKTILSIIIEKLESTLKS